MTEIDLLDGLAKEVKKALKDFRLRSAKENRIPINVYTQNLPLKEGKGDEKQYPYVCVCFDQEEIECVESKRMSLSVYFIIGVSDHEKDKQGFREVLQIANLIYQYLFRKGVIAKAFRLEYPFKILLQSEDTYPYFIGGMESRWEMPVMEEEDKFI